MKLYTKVEPPQSKVTLTLSDKIAVLGSCFADSIGNKLIQNGFSVSLNPFGALYNPLSIEQSVQRLDSAEPFTVEDCVTMGAGSDLVCSYSHHTSFARRTAEEFLENANSRLAQASAAWKRSDRVILTLGTAFVWRLSGSGRVVSNCLKQPSATFTRWMMTVDEVEEALGRIIGAHPDKQFILTVSPIRHLSDGAHANTLSKATLQIAADRAVAASGGRAVYFPSYEILLDELRDYRFYADDLVHPSASAVEVIWERFRECAIPPSEYAAMSESEKAFRRSQHREMHL